MAIQWFPGHMHKARKEIAKVMPDIDLVIEVLDARLPMSSANPLVEELRGEKPVIKLLNKTDLADPQRTEEWACYLVEQGFEVLRFTNQDKAQLARLVTLCKKLAPQRTNAGRPVRVLIVGIPNVGKSTLINSLMGRKIAKVGNEPAVTKSQQRFVTHNDLAIFDTPGILWPKIHDQDSTYRLATSGAIKDTVMEYEEVALYALEFLLKDYPEALQQRYKFKTLPETADLALEDIGRRRGGLRPGGKVDYHKASEVLIGDIRSGKIGQLTMETVSEWQEKIRLAELKAQEELELQQQQSQQ